MKKQNNNSFAGAALALCMKESELRERLDAHLELKMIKAERDRAIDSAYHENKRLTDLAKSIILAIKAIEEPNGKISKTKLMQLLEYAKNITTIEEATELAK